jgi:phage host-nuclease inhibitor protein Gam
MTERERLRTILNDLIAEQTDEQRRHRLDDLRHEIRQLWRSGHCEAAMHQQFALYGMLTLLAEHSMDRSPCGK